MESAAKKIRRFLAGYLKHTEFGDHEDLFSTGYINSLFAMQLIFFLENEFQIVVGNEDLSLENFKSIDNMVAFIEKKIPLTAPGI